VALGKRLNATAAEMVAQKLMHIADADGSGAMSRVELRGAIRKIAEGGEGDEGALSFERAFEQWLRTQFLPAALKAAAKKKLL
jgi:hypothetical protein